MAKINDLSTGHIPSVISRLAAPLIGASFIQMTYTMVDLLWLSKLGSGAVAAVGAAFFYNWLNTSISFTTKMGAEISVAQSIGAGDKSMARNFSATSIMIACFVSVLVATIAFIFAPSLISIFNLEGDIAQLGIEYIRWASPALVMAFLINTFAAVFYGSGDSKTPFRYISMGLVVNIVLDPLFIFGFGPIPAYGVKGAAIATVIANIIVFTMFVRRLYSSKSPLGRLPIVIPIIWGHVRQIFKLGIPITIQSALFSIISMSLASQASKFGHTAVAALSLGNQIEAISWNTASGFSTALSSFVGQNYGSKSYNRIRSGFHFTLLSAGSIGFLAGLAFISFPERIYGCFINEPEALSVGAQYLRIMGYSQLLMVVELVTSGGFNGVGRTQIPAVVGISLNLLRIPMALLLINTAMEVSGIWWSITISSCMKGALLLCLFYLIVLKRMPKTEYGNVLEKINY